MGGGSIAKRTGHEEVNCIKFCGHYLFGLMDVFFRLFGVDSVLVRINVFTSRNVQWISNFDCS